MNIPTGTIGARHVSGEIPVVAHRKDVDAPQVYTTGAAAKLCGVSQKTIIRCFDTGLLDGFKVPGSKFRRITRAGLLKFMLANRIPPDALGNLTDGERAMFAAKDAGRNPT